MVDMVALSKFSDKAVPPTQNIQFLLQHVPASSRLLTPAQKFCRGHCELPLCLPVREADPHCAQASLPPLPSSDHGRSPCTDTISSTVLCLIHSSSWFTPSSPTFHGQGILGYLNRCFLEGWAPSRKQISELTMTSSGMYSGKCLPGTGSYEDKQQMCLTS